MRLNNPRTRMTNASPVELGVASSLGGSPLSNLSIEPQKSFSESYAHHHHRYIYDPIGDASEFIDLIEILNNASPYDIFHLRIATGGGILNTAITLIHAIKRTDANVVGYADGEVASAGTLILLACDEFVISPYSHMMIHDGSYGLMGKTSEMLSSAKHTTKHLKTICNDIYFPFLSKLEIKGILHGADLYLSSKQMTKRLKRLMKYREEQAKALEE